MLLPQLATHQSCRHEIRLLPYAGNGEDIKGRLAKGQAMDLTAQMQWKIFAETGLGVRYTNVSNITKSQSMLIYPITG